jgi:hypothetical protein
MIVVDVLLALNLVVFVVCAIRAPRQARRGIDELVAAARRPASGLGMHIGAPACGNVIPFRSREELRLAHAKAIHPSGGVGH